MDINYNNYENITLSDQLEKNIADLKDILGNSMDLKVTPIKINRVECAVLTAEAMVSTIAMSELVYAPLMELEGGEKNTPRQIMEFVMEESLMTNDRVSAYTFGSVVRLLFSGFAIILVNKIPYAAALGIQGYAARQVSTPMTENDLLSSQEAFVEVIRTNISLIRRRVKHPALTFEMTRRGKLSNTDICMVYIRGKADPAAVEQIRRRLSEIKLDCVLGAGFVKPYLEKEFDHLLFSEVGTTERPDMLCTNLMQGRIGILVDGAPFCLICPFLFAQNFDNIDDYASKTYFAVFLKFIRYIAFILSIALPGMYIAAVNFNPEMLNLKLLLNLATGEKTTLLSIFSELIIIMILLEILREASVRLPQAIGTAMSIAGGLIIGDTAVKSGIISSPLLIVVGITATASFVLPSFSQQISVLRITFIFAGGFAGFFGISVCSVMVIANICSQSFVGVPFTSPLVPFKSKEIISVIGRKNFVRLQDDNTTMKDFA